MSSTKSYALDRLARLVADYQKNSTEYRRQRYNETQARTEFISPLLKAFGWDVQNQKALRLGLREVIQEASVEVETEKAAKKPDYELRIARQRKLFVEAKKPSIDIENNMASAFQIRRYGYSANLPISVLTNFRQLAVYDCKFKPEEDHEPQHARILFLSCDTYVRDFEMLWDVLSRDIVSTIAFDERYQGDTARRGTGPFDSFFLEQVKGWRRLLAQDIRYNCPALDSEALTYVVQLFLCRIVFLRICEDRNIERYETLKGLTNGSVFVSLMEELKRADKFYDSGLFKLLNDERFGIRISDGVLRKIISHLYYPKSPFTFSVIETEVLGQVYDQFLGEILEVTNDRIDVIPKPEVRASGGVFPTPRYVVDAIVDRTLYPAIVGKSPDDLKGFSVADIACGSGTFLLSAYETLLEHYLSFYLSDGPFQYVGHQIYEVANGEYRLTFGERRRILLEHIRGVDIDSNAVDIARFSLLLKLIEDETSDSLQDYMTENDTSVLPDLEDLVRCGNSLVSYKEWAAAQGHMAPDLRPKVNPFDWRLEFSTEMSRGGFDVIVGNPPYVRIQYMSTYASEEVGFYRNSVSPYTTSQVGNFDKYALFVERGSKLLNSSGRLGFIVPHKFMTIKAGVSLRRLLSEEELVEEIVHFGVQSVFGPEVSNYTCLLILTRKVHSRMRIEIPSDLERWRYGEKGAITEMALTDLTEEPWLFLNDGVRSIFDRVRGCAPVRLVDIADIFVGVQTSADSVYIFKAVSEDSEFVMLRWNSLEWPIEREILRPCLMDVSLDPYASPEANRWMIFPYERVRSGKVWRTRVIQSDDFQNKFPECWRYLNARRSALGLRNVTGGRAAESQWYQYGRSQSLAKFDGPKIILPILSLDACYVYDDRELVVTGGGNGPYYMIRSRDNSTVSNHYLLSILHHPVSEAIVRSKTSSFKGGYYSHGKQFIEGIPIPLFSESERDAIGASVKELIAAFDDARNCIVPQRRLLKDREIKDLREDIEQRISTLLDLSEAEMEAVRAVAPPG